MSTSRFLEVSERTTTKRVPINCPCVYIETAERSKVWELRKIKSTCPLHGKNV